MGVNLTGYSTLQARGPADDHSGAAQEVRGRLINLDPSKASYSPGDCRTG